ncbi:MAG: cytochrome c-type biogenesis protein CcmH [Nitrospinae bacterium]|nr:cytochrome c-type biogenesis protein CcmH [Nitrospinota bacterium]
MKPMRIPMILIAALLLCAGPSVVFAATLMADLENALMCKCDDKCGKVLINCTCDTSKETRKALMSKLESGLTFDQIVKQYVDKYGETVLSAPSKSGFNLLAWITPFAALVIGGFGVRQVIHSWARPASANSDSKEDDPQEAAPEAGKYSKRLKDELDRLES